jgi:purine-binding chemotaxis protein CheW
VNQLATFHVGRYLCGVDVALVQEVVRLQRMTPVPLAAPAVAGLVNLRGQVLTALDVRSRMGMPPRDDGRDPVNVVIRIGEEPVSLLVDEIGAVLDVTDLPFEPTPSTVDESLRGLILGAFTLPDRLLLALNAVQLLSLGELRAA